MLFQMARSKLRYSCLALARWSPVRLALASAPQTRLWTRSWSTAPYISEDATVRAHLPAFVLHSMPEPVRPIDPLLTENNAIPQPKSVSDVASLRHEILAVGSSTVTDVKVLVDLLERCLDSSLDASIDARRALLDMIGGGIRSQVSSADAANIYVPLIRVLLRWPLEDEITRGQMVWGFLDHWKETSRVSESDMIRSLLYHAKPEDVVLLSQLYSKNQKVLSPTVAFMLMQALVRAENAGSVWRLFDYARRTDVRRERRFYNAAVLALVRANDKSGAFTVVKTMLNDQFKPDITTFNALLSGFTQKDNVEGAHSVLEMMRESGISTDSTTHSYLLSMYLRTGHTDKAVRLVERMTGKGKEQLTIAQFNSIVSRLLRDNEIARAIRVVTRHTDILGPMDLISYNLQLRVWVRAQRLDKAQKLFAYMKRDGGVGVDNVSYSTMMDMYVKSGRPADTIELWHELRQHGKIEPDLVTCNCVLMAKAQTDGPVSALEFLDVFRQIGHVPDATSYNVILSASSRAGDLNAAKHVWKSMKRDDIQYTGASYVAMATVLAQRKGANECAKFLKEHTKYSPPICTLVLKRLTELGDEKAFATLWDVMWTPAMDLRVLSAGLKGASHFALSSRVEQIIRFLEQRPEKLKGTLPALLDILETGEHESRIMALMTEHMSHLPSHELIRLLKARRERAPLSLLKCVHAMARESETGMTGPLATELATAYIQLRDTNGLTELVEDVKQGLVDLDNDTSVSIVRALESDNGCLGAINAAILLSFRECLSLTKELIGSLASSAVLSPDVRACFQLLPTLARSLPVNGSASDIYHNAAMRAANESNTAESILCLVRYMQSVDIRMDEVVSNAVMSAHVQFCGTNAENVEAALQSLLTTVTALPREHAPHLPLHHAYRDNPLIAQNDTTPQAQADTHTVDTPIDCQRTSTPTPESQVLLSDHELHATFVQIESKLAALETEMKQIRIQHAELLETYYKHTRRKTP